MFQIKVEDLKHLKLRVFYLLLGKRFSEVVEVESLLLGLFLLLLAKGLEVDVV